MIVLLLDVLSVSCTCACVMNCVSKNAVEKTPVIILCMNEFVQHFLALRHLLNDQLNYALNFSQKLPVQSNQSLTIQSKNCSPAAILMHPEKITAIILLQAALPGRVWRHLLR